MCRQGIATLTVQVGLVQLIVGTLEEKGTLLLGSVVYCLYNVAFARLLRPITNIAIMGALSSLSSLWLWLSSPFELLLSCSLLSSHYFAPAQP